MKSILTLKCMLAVASWGEASENIPPAGFTALFNGQDLSGWYGWGTKDPSELWKMTPAELADYKRRSVEGGLPVGKAGPEHIKAHWRVEHGELVNDGHGLYLTTDKDYGDFERRVIALKLPQRISGRIF